MKFLKLAFLVVPSIVLASATDAGAAHCGAENKEAIDSPKRASNIQKPTETRGKIVGGSNAEKAQCLGIKEGC